MAKSAREELVARLRLGGLRRKVAESVAAGLSGTRAGRRPPKGVDRVIAELKTLTAELEDHASGGPARRKAARKTAAARKRNAAKRNTPSKKRARSRAKAG